MRGISFFIVLAVGALGAGCSTPSKSVRSEPGAQQVCMAYAREQLAMRGTPVDIYVFTATEKNGTVEVDVSPPPVKDPYKYHMYFGGGGTFVCDGEGKPISETFDK